MRANGLLSRISVLALAATLVVAFGVVGSAQQATPVPTPAGEANVCSSLVRAALESTDRQCGNTTRHQACYGHILNEALFRAPARQPAFETQGDKADLSDIQRLELSPLDLELEQWGVVLMQVQANLPGSLPGQNVTFILFGDVEVENAVGDPVKIEAVLAEDAAIRIAPGMGRAVIANLAAGTAIFASGRYFNAAGELWVRVGQSVDTQAFGWVQAANVVADLNRLPNVNPNDQAASPMQAFYFRTGIGAPQCIEAPRDGMVVQTPRGAGRINFTVNGIDVGLGSTAYITSPLENENTCVSLITGDAQLRSSDATVFLQPGQRSCVALDENGIADGPPSTPDSFDPNEIALLRPVLDALPDDVVIPDPAPSNTPTNTRVPPTRTATPTPSATATNTPEPPPATAVPTETPTRRPRRTAVPTAGPTLVPTTIPPVASFSFAVSAMQVTFTDASSNSPTSWSWSFGDSTSDSTQNPSHAYPYPGTAGSTMYTVSLQACNAGGCDTATQVIDLPNCNVDTGVTATVNFIPAAGICYGENYTIYPKDAFCSLQAAAGTVTAVSGFGTSASAGQRFFIEDANTGLPFGDFHVPGPGNFSFDVGTGSCGS
jgi:hypothetical protein